MTIPETPQRPGQIPSRLDAAGAPRARQLAPPPPLPTHTLPPIQKLPNPSWLSDLNDFKHLNNSLLGIHTNQLNICLIALKWTQTKLKMQLLCIS